MKETINKIEYHKIREMLSEYAASEQVKEKCLNLTMELEELKCKHAMTETTEARKLLDSLGLPPMSCMTGLQTLFDHLVEGYCLSEEQLSVIVSFLAASSRMKQYLKRGEYLSLSLCSYGYSLNPCEALRNEIERCIRNNQVDDNASPELKKIRREIEEIKDKIKQKLEQLLRSKPHYFADSYVSQRNGHFVLPVKKEYKNQLEGTVYDKSSTGNTIYIEPITVGQLHQELSYLELANENEVKRILYELTAYVYDNQMELKTNMQVMSDLDFVFAKGKLSQSMKAKEVMITTERKIKLIQGRHPLLPEDSCIPLDFNIGEGFQGVVITGPNTGGKTVALKTVGLLSMMVQSGLHVPVEDGSIFCMNNVILCDMGDGQSIEQNLSTFSSHIRRILDIFSQISRDSLVLLDELGSGTDPQEGMGIAIAILEELRSVSCLFVATTHYPEVKDYASKTKNLVNARMAFDKESLSPLYRLEIGEAGESCALYIARRLGMPGRILKNAQKAAYGYVDQTFEEREAKKRDTNISRIKKESKKKAINSAMQKFSIGDSVIVYPEKKIGIVFQLADENGDVGVQIQRRKKLVNHKRLKVKAKASEMYPDNYDFSIIFDSVDYRKASKQMNKHHIPDFMIQEETWKREWENK